MNSAGQKDLSILQTMYLIGVETVVFAPKQHWLLRLWHTTLEHVLKQRKYSIYQIDLFTRLVLLKTSNRVRLMSYNL